MAIVTDQLVGYWHAANTDRSDTPESLPWFVYNAAPGYENQYTAEVTAMPGGSVDYLPDPDRLWFKVDSYANMEAFPSSVLTSDVVEFEVYINILEITSETIFGRQDVDFMAGTNEAYGLTFVKDPDTGVVTVGGLVETVINEADILNKVLKVNYVIDVANQNERIYFDNVLVHDADYASTTWTLVKPLKPWTLGAKYALGATNFQYNDYWYSLKVYNKELTDTERQQNSSSGVSLGLNEAVDEIVTYSSIQSYYEEDTVNINSEQMSFSDDTIELDQLAVLFSTGSESFYSAQNFYDDTDALYSMLHKHFDNAVSSMDCLVMLYENNSRRGALSQKLFDEGISSQQTRQVSYSNDRRDAAMRQVLFQDSVVYNALNNILYEDTQTSVDTIQAMFVDGNSSIGLASIQYDDDEFRGDMLLTLYDDALSDAGVLQEWFEDNVHIVDTSQQFWIGDSFYNSLRQVLYDDASQGHSLLASLYDDAMELHPARQEMYIAGITPVDTMQELWQDGDMIYDTAAILYDDAGENADTLLVIFDDAALLYTTNQVSYTEDMKVISTIRLEASRALDVQLVGERALQELFTTELGLTVTLEASWDGLPVLIASRVLQEVLVGSSDLITTLEGDMTMAMEGQNFSMYAGDTKYIRFPVNGLTDLTGASVKWGMRSDKQATTSSLIKTTDDDISIVDNEVQILLRPEDTQGLKGTHYHECELTDVVGNVSTVLVGTVTISASAI